MNLYFAALSGGREGYWLYRQDIDESTRPLAAPRYLLVGTGGDLTCVCGNDASTDGFATCDHLGDVLDQDEDEPWDGLHYRCMTCDLVIAQPSRAARPAGAGRRTACGYPVSRKHPAVDAAGAVQLDLFGEVNAVLAAQRPEADAGRVRQQLRASFEALTHRHPATGQDLGSRVWCGRCGAIEVNDFLIWRDSKRLRPGHAFCSGHRA